MNTILKEVSCFNPRVNSIRLLEARPSLSSPSCPSFTATKYDVFLSFRGADTRKTFISFLYKELEADGIRTFKDDNELVSGHLISSELLQAIKDSKIAVVVVSANYPASNWCLQELVEILKLQKKGLLRVLPIFYEVEPCHLRRHTEKIREQFMKHEKRHSAERVKSWRDALTYLASLSGECSKDWEDSQLVDKITEDVSKMLPSTTPGVEKKLIGIDKHMNELYPMLDLNSSQGVRVIGIWGRGSIGRSALAKHVYEDISHNFEAHCFLQYVSTVPLHCRKSHLRKELYSKMQGQGLSIDSSHWCYNAIKARLGNRKVLLVANDVDDLEQLGALEEELNCYGPGSRLILTTQDRQLLTSSCVKSVYEPELLKCYQVRPLRSVAFKHKLGPMNLLPGVSKESLGHDVKQAQCPSSPNVQLKSSLQDLPKPATFTKNVPVVESKKQKETTLLQNSFDALLSLKE